MTRNALIALVAALLLVGCGGDTSPAHQVRSSLGRAVVKAVPTDRQVDLATLASQPVSARGYAAPFQMSLVWGGDLYRFLVRGSTDVGHSGVVVHLEITNGESHRVPEFVSRGGRLVMAAEGHGRGCVRPDPWLRGVCRLNPGIAREPARRTLAPGATERVDLTVLQAPGTTYTWVEMPRFDRDYGRGDVGSADHAQCASGYMALGKLLGTLTVRRRNPHRDRSCPV